MAIIGAASLTMLPVALELAVELTRNANASSAMLWASSNLFAVVLVLGECPPLLLHTREAHGVAVQGALRGGPDANPPYSMHRALVFQAVVVVAAVVLVCLLEGKQTRRAADERAQGRCAGRTAAESEMQAPPIHEGR